MPRGDPALLGLLEHQARKALSGMPASETLQDRVRGRLAVGLPQGEVSVEAIARALAISPRTLQRRLSDEQTSFQQVLDDVRREAAELHLRGSVLSIAEISFILGYSESAAFHRAFRRWNRITPQAFRAARPGTDVRRSAEGG
jgi:AraC-like DNA-binding protein